MVARRGNDPRHQILVASSGNISDIVGFDGQIVRIKSGTKEQHRGDPPHPAVLPAAVARFGIQLANDCETRFELRQSSV